MKIKIGINGMGRIGRMVIRSILESNNKDIIIKHINNRSNLETTCSLLKYDSIHGKFNADIKFDKKYLFINKNKISFSQESALENIDWKKNGVDCFSFNLFRIGIDIKKSKSWTTVFIIHLSFFIFICRIFSEDPKV